MEFNESATHVASITDLYLEAAKRNKVSHCRGPRKLEARLQAMPLHLLRFDGAPQHFEPSITPLIATMHLRSCTLHYLALEDHLLTLTR
jgi:hypothetical protein